MEHPGRNQWDLELRFLPDAEPGLPAVSHWSRLVNQGCWVPLFPSEREGSGCLSRLRFSTLQQAVLGPRLRLVAEEASSTPHPLGPEIGAALRTWCSEPPPPGSRPASSVFGVWRLSISEAAPKHQGRQTVPTNTGPGSKFKHVSIISRTTKQCSINVRSGTQQVWCL